MLREVEKGADLSYDDVITAAVVGIPSGVVLSKLLHVIDWWDYYSGNFSEILSGSGLTIYGAVLGAALGIWVYSRFSNFRFGYLANIIAPAIPLAQAVGRVGCTINGCCYGMVTSLPWGIVYTDPASVGYAATTTLSPGTGLHPTQVYEIIFNLILFAALLKLKGVFRQDGALFLVYLSCYAVWRLGIDLVRAGTPFLFGLHQAQVISIVVLAVAAIVLARQLRSKAG
jgi:phosphatidylglycerol:prolipoprotein diacylglycerol transferase